MPPHQNAKSHLALDPLTHFVLGPIFLLTLAFASYHYQHPQQHAQVFNFWLIVVAAALILLNIKTRLYSLRIQDRLIRLEERLRLATLLSPPELARAQCLTTPQLIALRFASDEEFSALVKRTLAESLNPKQIKQNISSWRADYSRI